MLIRPQNTARNGNPLGLAGRGRVAERARYTLPARDPTSTKTAGAAAVSGVRFGFK